LNEQEETEKTEKGCRACSVFSVYFVFSTRKGLKAQLLSYLKLLDIPLGLIINFNELKLTDGLSRLIIPGANLE
jgi:hypothetical protein